MILIHQEWGNQAQINNIEITYANSSVVLGAYNEENALKVLDVIEKTYCKRDSEYITFRMPKDENVSKIRM